MAFLGAIDGEARDSLDLFYAMERAWFSARGALSRRRKDKHDAAAVDVLATTPALSATTLARILRIAVKNAIRVLGGLVTEEIAIEVAHRAKRRLFALRVSPRCGKAVRPPYRPDPNRGRPRLESDDEVPEEAPPLAPIERRAFDYTALEEGMAHLDAVVRNSQNALRSISRGGRKTEAADPDGTGRG